jgi:hypothetical protein
MAVGFIVAAHLDRRRAKAQFSWTRVSATVVSSSLGIGGGFFPDIHYEYVHEGRRIRGLQFQTSPVAFATSRGARTIIAKYPVGTALQVFVDPSDPDNAVIEAGGDRKMLTLAYVIASFGLFAGTKLLLAIAH